MNGSFLSKGIVGIIIALFISAVILFIVVTVFKITNSPADGTKIKGYLSDGNEKAVVEIYNEEGTSEDEKAVIYSYAKARISSLRKSWDKGNTSEDSLEILSVFLGMDNSDISETAERHIKYITAEKYLSEKDYKAFVIYYNDQDLDETDRELIDSELDAHILAIKESWENGTDSLYGCVRTLNIFTDIYNDRISSLAGDTIQYISTEEYIKNNSPKMLMYFYNTNTFSEKVKKQIDEDIFAYIDDIVMGWREEKSEFSRAKESLVSLKEISDTKISAKSSESIKYLELEFKGDSVLEKALASYKAKNYIDAMKTSDKSLEKYSQYNSLKTIYEYSRNELLSGIKDPQTVDDYNKSIESLDTWIQSVEDSEFIKIRDTLKKELEEYDEVYSILMDAADMFDEEDYYSSFMKLKEGSVKYPEDKKIKYALSAFQYAYIINIFEEVINYTEEEYYYSARLTLENALELYDCDEFHMLLEDVMDESDYLYSTSARLGDTGYYVDKSGYKLIKDDFDEEEKEIIKSLSGKLSPTILETGIALDVRDLANDIGKWKDGEYQGARLVLDAVGAKPLVGAIKYLKHHDKAAPENEDAEDEEITETSIVETDKITSDIRKQASLIKEKSSESEKETVHYEPIITVNQSLDGGKHPKTGIKFEKKKIDLSDGRHITGVFPKFSSKYDVKLPEEYYKSSPEEIEVYLSDYMKETAVSLKGETVLARIFTEKEMNDMKNGNIPEGYVWHYSEKEGTMQLVDKEIHDSTGHTEGSVVWGNTDNKKSE